MEVLEGTFFRGPLNKFWGLVFCLGFWHTLNFRGHLNSLGDSFFALYLGPPAPHPQNCDFPRDHLPVGCLLIGKYP